MDISSFDDLLRAARAQPEPQRLLFVFVGVELPEDATPAQRERFQAGQGGALVPLMCVDKRPDELASFSSLIQESTRFAPELGNQSGNKWGMVFAAAMSGSLDRMPSSKEAEAPLDRMVEAIKRGEHGAYIPFDPQGNIVRMGGRD